MLLVGPSGSGKTTLFYQLTSKQEQRTVASSEVNVGSSETHTFMDIPGHYNFRVTLKSSLKNASRVILVVDSKDKDKFNQAADILYDILSDIDTALARVPILVACNK